MSTRQRYGMAFMLLALWGETMLHHNGLLADSPWQPVVGFITAVMFFVGFVMFLFGD